MTRTAPIAHSSRMTLAKAIAAMTTAFVVALAPVGTAATASAAPATDTGFDQPFAGVPGYQGFAPTQAQTPDQVNMPLGQQRADQLARQLGFDPARALSPRQYALFITGRGKGGGTPEARKAAQLSEASIRYLTNTTATKVYRTINGVRTRILLGSYGLIVDKNGLLESPANQSAPTRQINWVIAPQAACRTLGTPPAGIPCGYLGAWMRANGAKDTLAALYASAYPASAASGSKAQKQSEPHELVINTRPDGSTVSVGMAMAPPIWFVNFLLAYALNPRLAANMPAYWAPLPDEVSKALYASKNGQVPYADYMEYFPR